MNAMLGMSGSALGATRWVRVGRVAVGLSLLGALLSACQPVADQNAASTAESAKVAATPAAVASVAVDSARVGLAAQAVVPEKAVLGLLATAAGLHALGEHCGQLKADARSDAIARLKTRWVGEGVQKIQASAFDGAYASSYDETKRRIAEQPERAKQACGELPELEQQAQKALQAMSAVKP